jgi:hypothetical protein
MSEKLPQVYLELYHGRKHPDEDLEDWGSQGPVLGPLNHVVTTYLHTIRLLRYTDENGKTLTGDECVECFMAVYDDMIYYDGVFYGDWAVFADPVRCGNTDEGPVLPEESKCILPEEFRKLLRPSKTDILYKFLLEFDETWAVQYRDKAEEVWKELAKRGVDRERVTKNLKPKEDTDA